MTWKEHLLAEIRAANGMEMPPLRLFRKVVPRKKWERYPPIEIIQLLVDAVQYLLEREEAREK